MAATATVTRTGEFHLRRFQKFLVDLQIFFSVKSTALHRDRIERQAIRVFLSVVPQSPRPARRGVFSNRHVTSNSALPIVSAAIRYDDPRAESKVGASRQSGLRPLPATVVAE